MAWKIPAIQLHTLQLIYRLNKLKWASSGPHRRPTSRIYCQWEFPSNQAKRLHLLIGLATRRTPFWLSLPINRIELGYSALLARKNGPRSASGAITQIILDLCFLYTGMFSTVSQYSERREGKKRIGRNLLVFIPACYLDVSFPKSSLKTPAQDKSQVEIPPVLLAWPKYIGQIGRFAAHPYPGSLAIQN